MKTVLLIEDHLSVADIIELVLLYGGYKVVQAHNGADGLAHVRNGVSLIILDLALPDIDGLTILEQLKSNASTAHIPVLVLTAISDQEIRKQAFAAGCAAFINKPFDVEQLLDQVYLLSNPYERCV
jgi:two-component system cell cycle response regulator DivK